MPLNTQVTRNGKAVKLEWSEYTLYCMYTAAFIDADPAYELASGKTFGDLEPGEHVEFMYGVYYIDAPKVPLVSKGQQTLKRTYSFNNGELVFRRGDVLSAYRSHRS